MLVDEHNDVKEKIKQTSLLVSSNEEDEEMMDETNDEKSCSSIIEKATLNNNFKNYNPIEISKHVKIYFEPLLAKKFF